MTKDEPLLEFTFKPIKLDEIPSLIPMSFRSKYTAIREQVINAIQKMPGDESFMMQLDPKKYKLNDNLTKNICNGINTALINEQLPWKVVFSEKVHAFVVAPKKMSMSRKLHPGKHNYKIAKNPEELQKLEKIVRRTFGVDFSDISGSLVGHPENKTTRQAVVYVGRHKLGIRPARFCEAFKLSSAMIVSSERNAQSDPDSKEKVAILTKALNGGN